MLVSLQPFPQPPNVRFAINIVATVQLDDDDDDELPSVSWDAVYWSTDDAELVWLPTPALLWWWPVTVCSPVCCRPSRFEWRLRWEAALYLDSGRHVLGRSAQGNTSAMLTARCTFVSDAASDDVGTHCASARPAPRRCPCRRDLAGDGGGAEHCGPQVGALCDSGAFLPGAQLHNCERGCERAVVISITGKATAKCSSFIPAFSHRTLFE